MAQFDDLSLNIIWLTALWNFSHAWQINHRQIDDSTGEDFAQDGLRADLFVVAAFALCINFDFISRLLKVKIFFAWLVCKLNPVLGC